MIKKLLELNIFKSDSNTNHQLHNERIATRLYVLFLVILLSIFAIYTFSNKNLYHQTILNPNQNEYFQLKRSYSDQLSCSCRLTTIPYGNFSQIEVLFHEICSSDLISSVWIDYISKIDTHDDYHPRDYRLNGGSHFLALRTFCQQSEETINHARKIFYQTKLISEKVLPKDIFYSQINSIIENWKSNTINTFLRTIDIIRATTQGNQLMNGFLNVDFLVNIQTTQTTMTPSTFSNCSCALSRSCHELMAIYQYNNLTRQYQTIHSIPHFYIGCFLFESFLLSTLECFYNRSCMIEIDQYMYQPLRSAFNFSSLQMNFNSTNATIESIIHRLMIDEWLINISYSSYYSACSPSSCVLEYIARNEIFYVLTTIIGVFGGLSLLLKIILIVGLRLIKKRAEGFGHFHLRNFIKNLFIYQNEGQLINHLHFIFVVIALSVLYAISAFTPQLEIIEILHPSLSSYTELARKYANNFQCSCREISIKYQTFIQIEVQFHEICSSEFLTSDWINALYGQGNLTSRYIPIDFFYSGFSQFQLLSSFCQLAEEIVNGALLQFMNNSLINAQLLSEEIFEDNIQTIIHQLELTIPQILLNTLSLIRETTGSNRIMTSIGTSWRVETTGRIGDQWRVLTMPLIYQECNCALSPKCIISSRGMLTGCYPLEALFQSTFLCLYFHQCQDSIQSFHEMNISLHQQSRFGKNSTIESIINELLVEQYLTNISYEKYFQQCNVSVCSRFQIDKTNTVDGITHLIALYGGLMIICRVFAVILTKIIWFKKVRVDPILQLQHKTVHSITTTIV